MIVTVGSGKPGRQAFARICAAEWVGVLVTDSAASPDTVRGFEEAGITVVAV